jgi:DNA-binding transcriptional MerR regulator
MLTAMKNHRLSALPRETVSPAMPISEQDPAAPAAPERDRSDGAGAQPSGEQLLSLGNVAQMFGVLPIVLRYYEWRGLVRRRRRMGREWVYGWGDCERIAVIVKGRRAGLPLREIATILEATDDDASEAARKSAQELCMALVGRLELRRKGIDEALSELSHIYALLTTRILGVNDIGRDSNRRS